MEFFNGRAVTYPHISGYIEIKCVIDGVYCWFAYIVFILGSIFEFVLLGVSHSRDELWQVMLCCGVLCDMI